MHTVQDGQQDLGQAQQVIEVVKAKVNQIPGQVHHLLRAAQVEWTWRLCEVQSVKVNVCMNCTHPYTPNPASKG